MNPPINLQLYSGHLVIIAMLAALATAWLLGASGTLRDSGGFSFGFPSGFGLTVIGLSLLLTLVLGVAAYVTGSFWYGLFAGYFGLLGVLVVPFSRP